MSSFLSKIFKSTKKSHHEQIFQPQDDYNTGQPRGSMRYQGFGRGGGDYDTGILKSSMRRRGTAPIYEDENFLRSRGAAYQVETKPKRYHGPRSLPPGALDDSPNASPSSSTDGGYGLEKSFHSEFIPPAQPSSSRRKSKKQHRFVLESRPRQRFYGDREETDSENPHNLTEELKNAMKQIQKFQKLFANATDECRRLRYENDIVVKESHRNKLKVRQLEAEVAQLSQEKRSLEVENTSLKSMLCIPPIQPRFHYPPSYPYNYMTPPSNLRNQLNNTNTGSAMASSGGPNFRPPPTGNNLFEGCGEELAFMSATTTASNARLPGMPVADDIQDEVKVFRKADETSPSRPPTNSNQSFNLSSGLGGSHSTGSTPPHQANEQTPILSAAKKKSPFEENPKLALFNEILSHQQAQHDQTPKSRRFKRPNSTSCLEGSNKPLEP